MIGHEDIGVKASSALALCVLQAVEEDLVILISKENRLAVVPSLNDVVGKGGNGEPRQPGYGGTPSATEKGGEAMPLADRRQRNRSLTPFSPLTA